MPLMRGTGNGNLFIGIAQPGGWGDGDLWVDTSTLPRKVKVNNNGAALLVSGEDVGSIKYWPAAAASFPTNFLACDGSAISRTTYLSLFNVIGTTWGVGDGITTFNIPDFRAKYSRGATIDGDIATAVGEDTHILTVAELAAHTHTAGGLNQTVQSGGGVSVNQVVNDAGAALHLTTSSTGSGIAHENRPASLHCYFIIKAT